MNFFPKLSSGLWPMFQRTKLLETTEASFFYRQDALPNFKCHSTEGKQVVMAC